MRKYLVALIAVVAIAGSAGAGETARQTKSFNLGGGEFVALLDIVGQGNTDLLIGAGETDLQRAKQPGALDTTINAFLLKKDGKTYLFDTGLPPQAGGGLAAALEQTGIDPADIDAVIITHFHFDHVGGLLKDGKRVFTNAELYVPRIEVDKWSEPGTAFLTAYPTSAFEWDAEILPGIKALRANGHTPGHTVFDIGSGDQRVLIIGDLIHLPGIQLPNPRVAVTYDIDPDKAVASRLRLFNFAADEGMPVASMHIPFPGVGTLARDGEGFSFTPRD